MTFFASVFISLRFTYSVAYIIINPVLLWTIKYLYTIITKDRMSRNNGDILNSSIFDKNNDVKCKYLNLLHILHVI